MEVIMLRLNDLAIAKISTIFLGLFCSVNLFAMADGVNATGICIFDDTGESAGWTEPGVPTKTIFLKAVCKKAPHIFITPNIWHSFVRIRQDLLGQLRHYNHIQNPTRELSIQNGNVIQRVGNYHYTIGDSRGLPALDALKPAFYTGDGFGMLELLSFDAEEWNLYDTHTGLYYLQRTDTPPIGIQVQNFTQLNPNNLVAPTTYFEHWTDGLYYLFDAREWNQYNQQSQQKAFVYIFGHGSPRAQNPHEIETACGMPGNKFAYLLQFFNDIFHIDMLGIQTCYWTAQRAAELMQRQYNYDFLNYAIISLLETEQQVYNCALMPISQFDPNTQRMQFQTDAVTFYEALSRATQRYAGQMSHEMMHLIRNVDERRCAPAMQAQRPTYLLPGQMHAQAIPVY